MDIDEADMSLQWLVPEAETQPVWDLFARVFRAVPYEWGNPLSADPPFFADPGWTVIGLVNNLDGLTDPPGGPEEVCSGLLTWDEWRQRLESDEYVERDGFYERDELGPLLDIMAGEGAQALYFTEAASQVPGPMQAAAASRAGLQAAMTALYKAYPSYGLPRSYVFDDTGRWGLFVEEDNIAALAGEPAIMERYLPQVGGLEFLQQRFAERIREEVDPEGDNYWIGSVRTFRLWYAYMRWPWPFPRPPLTVPERTGKAET